MTTVRARKFVGTQNCATCGKPFQLRADAAKVENRGKYCSIDCSNRGRSLPLVADVADLRRLYVEEKKTTREIAAIYGSTWKHVSRALKRIGVKPKPGREGRGKKRSYLLYRKVAEKTAGRLLKSQEIVHHIDANWKNNDPANLAVVSRKRHSELHKQLEAISAQLFTAGLITFDHQTGYRMTDMLKSLLK